MTEAPEDIASDAEVDRVHANANFGSTSKREVLDEGVLKYAFGYSGGHTQLCILEEHGLVRKTKPRSYGTSLTKKGQRYLRAVYGAHLEKIYRLCKGESQ